MNTRSKLNVRFTNLFRDGDPVWFGHQSRPRQMTPRQLLEAHADFKTASSGCYVAVCITDADGNPVSLDDVRHVVEHAEWDKERAELAR